MISVFQPGIGLLTQLNLAVLLLYGGYLVIDGQLLLGEGLFVFANLLQQFANQVTQITNITNSIQASLTGCPCRVFEVLDAPLEITSPAHARHVRLEPSARGGGASRGSTSPIGRAIDGACDVSFAMPSQASASPWSPRLVRARARY